jgi:hypothetical protein
VKEDEAEREVRRLSTQKHKKELDKEKKKKKEEHCSVGGET